jgi:hypothetical protein
MFTRKIIGSFLARSSLTKNISTTAFSQNFKLPPIPIIDDANPNERHSTAVHVFTSEEELLGNTLNLSSGLIESLKKHKQQWLYQDNSSGASELLLIYDKLSAKESLQTPNLSKKASQLGTKVSQAL